MIHAPRHKDLIQYNWYRYAIKGFTEIQRLKYRRTVRYYSQMLIATPKWAKYNEVLDLYLFAAIMRRQGCAVQTDHIVPIHHPYVCGLHCSDNLRNIPTAENQRKSNNYWPDMWSIQMDFLEQ